MNDAFFDHLVPFDLIQSLGFAVLFCEMKDVILHIGLMFANDQCRRRYKVIDGIQNDNILQIHVIVIHQDSHLMKEQQHVGDFIDRFDLRLIGN